MRRVIAFMRRQNGKSSGARRGPAGRRRRGLATALLCQSLHALKAAGMTEAALGVDTANPHHALALYERCGFRVVQELTCYEKLLAQGLRRAKDKARRRSS